MRRTHPLFRHGPLAASLCAFLAASVLASTSVGPEPGDLPAPPVMADNGDNLLLRFQAKLQNDTANRLYAVAPRGRKFSLNPDNG